MSTESPAPKRREGAGLIVIGPTPPPAHGVSVMTLTLLDALQGSGRLAGHLDTADRRPIETVGRLDWRNLWLGVVHLLQLQRLLLIHRGAALYVPISQGTWGFLRDASFLLSARLWRRRRFVHLHGGYFNTFYEQSGSAMRLVIRAALGGVEQAWALTPALRAELEGVVPSDRVGVLENAVDDHVSAPTRAEHDGPVRVLYLANLLPEKGCFDLMEAVEELARRGTPLEVRFVGDAAADVEESLAARARAIGGTGVTVELTGALRGAERDAQYAWADIFAFPTKYPFEGQPLVLLEALAAGLPVVSTWHRGVPETVRHEREALLVDPGDAPALARAIERLHSDPGLRRALGENARARYEAHYTPERFREDLRALLG
jgi:glycosyltransferase involved in cell wall biosynthesis